MNAIRLVAAAAVVGLLGVFAGADEKKADSAKLIVGKWEVVEAFAGGPPKGGTVEFTKDGKFKIAGEQGGNKVDYGGTYKIDGKKLVLNFKMGDNEMPVEVNIDKLDDTNFVTSSDPGKVELKRKK